LLSCYQTRARDQVHTPQASYHLVYQSLHFANTQGHMLLLARAQFHYCDAVEVTIAIAIVELYHNT